MTDGRAICYRTVYEGLRTDGDESFNEARDLSVQPLNVIQRRSYLAVHNQKLISRLNWTRRPNSS
jgi:hypothetical protein